MRKFIGVDIGGTKVKVATIDETGKVLSQTSFPSNKPEDELINQIVDSFEDLDTVDGVGVGVAGQVEPHSGKVIFAPNLQWWDFPLKEKLQKRVNKPIAVLNDVKAATYGEWFFGAGRGAQEMACIFVGTGIGGGVISGGKMLNGCTNAAGEIGHMVIQIDGPPCKCGSNGCFEALASGTALKNLNLKPDSPQVIKALVAGTLSVVHAFNPCRIIFGGGVILGNPEIIPLIEAGVKKQGLKASTQNLQVLKSELGEDAGVIGAAGFLVHSSRNPV